MQGKYIYLFALLHYTSMHYKLNASFTGMKAKRVIVKSMEYTFGKPTTYTFTVVKSRFIQQDTTYSYVRWHFKSQIFDEN